MRPVSDRVSGANTEAMVRRTPKIASRTKTPRHEATSRICPPIIGARMGASPFTSIKREKKRVSSAPS